MMAAISCTERSAMEQRSRPIRRFEASEKETSDWMPSLCLACGTIISSVGFIESRRAVIVTVLLPMGGASCEYCCVNGFVLREKFGEGFDGRCRRAFFRGCTGGRKRRTVSLVRLMMMLPFHEFAGDVSGEGGVVEFDTDHQAEASNFLDGWLRLGEGVEAVNEVCSGFGYMWARMPSRLMVSMTAMAAAQASGLPPNVVPCIPGWKAFCGRLRCRASRPWGTPPAIGFGEGCDVGHDAVVLIGEPPAGATDAALDLTRLWRSAPVESQSSRAAAKNSCETGWMPPSPWMVSMRMAQTSEENAALQMRRHH